MNLNAIIERCGSDRMLTQGVLLTEVLLLLYGIFLLIFPGQALGLSVAFIGIVMIVAGIACGVIFVLNRSDANYPLIALAAIGIIVGLLVLFFRDAIALILFPILLGLWTLLTGIIAAFAAIANHRFGNGLWWIPLLAAIVAFVVTVLIFMNLSGTERFMARILGIYFITYNIVRLGEFGALRMAPPEPPARRRRSSSSARRSARYEEEDDGYDVYDYEEDYAESEEDNLYSRDRSYSRYDDLDDDEDYRRYRRERGYDI